MALKTTFQSITRSRFIRDESGQGTIEYVLLLMVAVGAVIAVSRTILKALDQNIVAWGRALQRQLKTGRTPVDVWSNG